MSEEEKKRSMKNNRIRERMTIKIMMEGKDLENRKKYWMNKGRGKWKYQERGKKLEHGEEK